MSAIVPMIVADAGYWNQRQMEKAIDRGMPVIIPPDSNTRQGERPGWNDGLYAFMRRVIRSPEGGAIYRKTAGTDRTGLRRDQVQPHWIAT